MKYTDTQKRFAPQEFRLHASKYVECAKGVNLAKREMWERLKICRPLLSKPEYSVLRERWCRGKSLGEIGKELKVTRERIRQIEYKAFEKLKANDPLPFTSNHIPV